MLTLTLKSRFAHGNLSNLKIECEVAEEKEYLQCSLNTFFGVWSIYRLLLYTFRAKVKSSLVLKKEKRRNISF